MVGHNNRGSRRARIPGRPGSGLRRLIAATAATALVGGILVATEIGTPVAPAEARFATGGSGVYPGLIDWIEWGADAAPVVVGATGGSTRTIGGQQLVTSCEVDAVSGSVIAYRSGNYVGDGLDDLYNIGGTGTANELVSGLANATPSALATLHVACATTLDGVPVPMLGLVVADAEASTASQGEYVQATPDQVVTWRVIERLRADGCTTSSVADLDASGTLRLRTDGAACAQTASGGAGPIAVAFMDGATSATLEVQGGGRSAIALGVVLGTDFGDAPVSYGDAGALLAQGWGGGELAVGTTNLFDGVALGEPTPPATPRLGSTVDSESTHQPTVDATGDGADEDAITPPATLEVARGDAYTLPGVACTGPGTVAGWIDWNRDGQFEAAEQSDQVDCTGSTVDLAWTVTTDAVSALGGDRSFLRLRIAPDASQLTATGLATAGEVEDYALTVDVADAPLECPANAPGILFQGVPTQWFEVDLATGQFESVRSYGRTFNAIGYNQLDGFIYGYVVGSTTPNVPWQIVRISGTGVVTNLGRPAGIPDGVSFAVGDVDENGFYWLRTTTNWYRVNLATMGVISGTTAPPAGLTGGFDWAYVPGGGNNLYAVMSNASNQAVLVAFNRTTRVQTAVAVLDDFGDGNVIGAVYADANGYLYASNNTNGRIYRIDVQAGEAELFSQGPISGSNDGTRCAASPLQIDFGDAPTGYGTRLEDNGPRHTVNGYDVPTRTGDLMLGASVDIEDDGAPSATANGDDSAGVDDEGGVSAPIVLIIGQQASVAVSVTNNTAQPATLAGWIDLDDDGVFESGELQRVVVPASSGTTTQTLTFPAVGDSGDGTFARFRLLPGDVPVASLSPLGAVNGGEVEDYPVVGPVPVPDYGDAPDGYGTTAAVDGAAHSIVGGAGALRLGALVDADADGQPSAGADGDDLTGLDDEDGVHFAADVSVPDRLETVFVTASGAGFLNAWIDFDLDGQFDAVEQIFDDQPVVAGVNTLRYTVPSGAAFVAGESFARFRITSDQDQATSPTGLAPNGEVEDYARTLFDAPGEALQQCPAGTTPIPVSIIQNPSFETRTGDFQNVSAASTIGFAQNWDDSHPTGGQYHYFDPPTFDSGPAAATMPMRAGADGVGFEGGHTATLGTGESIGEGATNVLAQPLDPQATYVGFFSMSAGGYGREGNGFMQFFGTNDPNVGHYPGSGVVTPTAANTELLYSTPVVDYAGAGVAPTWQLHTFQLDANQAWPYLRVEVRNETPAANATVAGQVWMNFDDFQMFECDPTTDFGDAPASYGTMLDDDGARHAIQNYDADGFTAPIMLGSAVDQEDDGQPTLAADGDDTTDAADDDGVVFNSGLGYASPTLRTGLDPDTLGPVGNTLEVIASAEGFVSVWVDWNRDGDFLDAGEQVVNAAPVTSGANNIAFAQGTNPAGISSYVRVRYSTDAAAIAAPTGAAPDGEVEDYRVLFERLAQPDACVVNDNEYYAFTFAEPVLRTGAGGVGSMSRYANVTVIDGVAVDVVIETIAGAMNAGQLPPNGIGVGDGGIIGADDARWQINTEARLRYSFFVAGTSTPIAIAGVFTASDLDSSEHAIFSAADLAGYAVTEGSAVSIAESGGNVTFLGNGGWNGDPQSRFQVVLEGIENFEVTWQGGNGSGFGFDGDGDLSIQPPACSDFGDAPASYGTLLADDGARHLLIPGLNLGDAVDFDPDGQPTADADGDDDNRLADEDGVTEPIVMTLGQTAQVTVSATNTTGADAVLAGWIDLDGNGSFDAGELVTVDVPAGPGAQEHLLVFPSGTAPTDTFARFRLFPAGDTVSPIGAAIGGEVEDYPVTVLETELDIEKASDATADSRPGDTITYTVTAENTGTGDFTAAFPAVLSDDLSGVLDDASYSGDAVATIAGAPAGPVSLVGDVLVWSGPLAAGETVTVTYTVALTSDGDGVVRNVAWGGGGEPPECDPPVDGIDPGTGLPCDENSFSLPRLTIEKSADTTELPADGGVVTYTVTVTNTGPGDYTAAAPAVVTDDLTEVLDDASDPTGLAATIDGGPATAPVFTSPEIVWSGALASGEVLAISYSVTYDDSTGDNSLRNVACVDESETAPGAPSCDFVQIPAAGLTQWKQAEPSAVPTVAGSTITYTLFFANDGQADAAVDARDDLSHVLDDAAITSGPSSPDGLTTDLVGSFLGVTGTIPPGETYTVTYTVTVLPDDERGDDIATNFLMERDPGGEFPPTPGEPECVPTDAQFPDCTTTEFPAIGYEKAVVVSSDPIDAGTVLTYTITVRNTGAATGTLNKVDDLSGVLDDAALTAPPSADTPSVVVSSVSGGVFSIGGSLAAGGVAVISYEVTVLPQAERGDDTAANFVLNPGENPPADCDPSIVPCTVTELPHIVVTKSVGASSDPVATGTVLSYTITFENQGLAAGVVDKVDDLSGVLDDADLTSDPVASDSALTASSVVGDEFSVTGTLQPAQLVTVTYEVTVRDETERGDSLATNFVLDPGEDPPTDCDPDVVPCTATEMPEIHDRKDVNPVSGTPVVAGQQLTYTLTFRNDGTAPGAVDRVDDLTHVVDDADLIAGPDVSDAALTASGPDAGNRITVAGVLEPGAVVTLSYTVEVRASGDRGDDIMANFLLDPDGETPVDPTCEPAPGQEPDCTINAVGEILPRKSSDPVSWSDIGAGQRITYTLSFENVGQGAAAVDYTDYLAGVLDDADLVSGPTPTGGLSTSGPDAGEIQVGGTVSAGATETVTYTVVVRPYALQGDHRLGNYLVAEGFDPPTLCDPNDPLCTWHEMDPPPPGLSQTGATVGASALLALVLLLAGGGLLLYRRRRATSRT